MTKTIEWKKTQPGSTEAVQFNDGMLVTAEDLGAAMRYPLSVIQVLLKAYFGCGIVCGLDIKHPGEEQAAQTAAEEAEPGDEGAPRDGDLNFILTIERGVALGCDGYPIEICGPLKLDLTPDPCRKDRGRKEMFVAARRVTAAEAAARPCGCVSTGGGPAQQCTRMRDHALVQAFVRQDLPAELCRAAAPPAKTSIDGTSPRPNPAVQPGGAAAADCASLKQCGECACCGDPWVLLGSVWVDQQGLGTVDRSVRRYVKPIACICPESALRSRSDGDAQVTRTVAKRGIATPAKETTQGD
jgi:hypothetical protein